MAESFEDNIDIETRMDTADLIVWPCTHPHHAMFLHAADPDARKTWMDWWKKHSKDAEVARSTVNGEVVVCTAGMSAAVRERDTDGQLHEYLYTTSETACGERAKLLMSPFLVTRYHKTYDDAVRMHTREVTRISVAFDEEEELATSHTMEAEQIQAQNVENRSL